MFEILRCSLYQVGAFHTQESSATHAFGGKKVYLVRFESPNRVELKRPGKLDAISEVRRESESDRLFAPKMYLNM